MPYFQAIELAINDRDKLDSNSLHAAISSPVHRRHLLAYRFLIKTLGEQGAIAAREESNEARRLEAILVRAEGKAYAQLLKDFVDAQRVKGTANRTIRLYAGVAQSFCERADASSDAGWRQGAVLVFLKHTPGAASSLSAFVGFCRRHKGWDVSMPSKQVQRELAGVGQHAEDRLRKALTATLDRPVGDLKLFEVARVIAAATGLSLRNLIGATTVGPEGGDGSIFLAVDAQIVPGHPLHPYAVRWRALLDLRQAMAQGVVEAAAPNRSFQREN